MRYAFRDLPALLRTPLGRTQLREGALHRCWPVLFRLALAHRAMLARRTRVVAVVGSLGKTTTARATAAVLGQDPEGLARNYFSYLATSVLGIRPGQRHAVFEVGIDRAGQMAGYARLIRPDVVVVTSIASEHNPNLRSLEATRAEKSLMVAALPPSGLAVLNGDDANVLWMRSRTSAAIRTFGFQPGNDVRATDVVVDWPHGTRLTVHAAGESRSLRVCLLGNAMLYPVLAATSVALAEGVALEDALAALERLSPSPGRMETLALPGGAHLIRDEFKSGLETVEAALDVLAAIPAKRRILVLGDVEEPPEDATSLYARLGARVATVAEHAIFVHVYRDGPRYADGARAGGMPSAALVEAADLTQAVDAVRAELRPGDVVLVKGGLTQRLDRVSLRLMGRPVACTLRTCRAKGTRCDGCSMLERGWQGLSPSPFAIGTDELFAPRPKRPSPR